MPSSTSPKLQILSGRAHTEIAKSIAKFLGVEPCEVELGDFANGEVSCSISESVRGNDVYVIQSHCGDVNRAILEQAIIIDSAKRASAASITAICPFLAYARQDRKSKGREPITARLLIDILAQAGADRIVSVDLHTGQIQGFFDGPFDHLIARPIFIERIKHDFQAKDLVVVSPDAGRVKSAERYSNALGCDMAIIHKHRSKVTPNSVEAKHLIGSVEGKICIIVDDMIDTAGTICAAADLIHEHGAKDIYAVITHGLFSPPAEERINKSKFTKIYVADTLPQNKDNKKIEVLSTAPIIAKAIEAIHAGGSVSSIFDGDNQY